MVNRKRQETEVEKQARLQRINNFFDTFTRVHGITVEKLANEAHIPVDNLYKWQRGVHESPRSDTIIKLIKYTTQLDRQDTSGRVLSLIYGADVINYLTEITDEERVVLEERRKLKDSQRHVLDSLVVIMLAENDK